MQLPTPSDRLRPLLFDTALTAVFLVIWCVMAAPLWGKQPDALWSRPLDAGAAALSFAHLLPMLGRRRLPLVMFVISSLALLGQDVLGYGRTTTEGVASAVLLYSTGRYGARRDQWIAALLLIPVAWVLRAGAIGSVDPVPVLGLALILSGPVVTGVLMQRERDRVFRLGAQMERETAERLAQVRDAVAAERRAIARDVHDAVAQSLSYMVVEASAARRRVTDPVRAGQALTAIAEAGRGGLEEMRALLGMLREQPDTAAAVDESGSHRIPALTDLPALVDTFRDRGLRVTLDVAPDLLAGGRAEQTSWTLHAVSLYRIVQEALTNAAKHAGPDTTVQVTLGVAGDKVRLTVRDHGPPTPVRRRARRPDPPGFGYGLVGVRERVLALGGTVEAGPDGAGWRVGVTVPAPSWAAR